MQIKALASKREQAVAATKLIALNLLIPGDLAFQTADRFFLAERFKHRKHRRSDG
jgi:hypothetical protein